MIPATIKPSPIILFGVTDSSKNRMPKIIPHITVAALFAKAVDNGMRLIICCHPIAYIPNREIMQKYKRQKRMLKNSLPEASLLKIPAEE